jgi:hypothetical protein
MKITIEPTEHFFMAGDVMVRMWQGTDESGGQVIALVTAVAFAGQAHDLVETECLVSIPPPTPEEARRWAEKIMEMNPPPP